jgi:2-iminobutanoate/2-iminopropanoate deaminase
MVNPQRLLLVLVPSLILFVSCATIIPDKKVIVSNRVPDTIGASSQAIEAGNTLYMSAQLGLEPTMGQLVPGGILAETQQALRNVDTLLREAGYTQRDVVQVNIYLTNMNDYQTVQMVFDNYFTGLPPTVNYVEVARLPRGASVSIVVTAER